MIPIQIKDTEKAALQILKPAIEHALYEANIELEIPTEYTGVKGFYDHNLKIKKLAYAAIEEFELPLIRTWYKYGQYEPYEELRPKRMEVGANAEDAYIPSRLKKDITQTDIKDFLIDRDLISMFEQDIFSFLEENYREWDPQPYTNAYIYSTEVIELLEIINSVDRDVFLSEIGDINSNFTQASIDLRYELDSIETFDDEVAEHAKDYLKSFENALTKVDETSEISNEGFETIRESRRTYHEYVLPWLALKISLHKARGPENSIDDFSASGQNILRNDRPGYITYLKGWKSQLDETDLSLSFSHYQSMSKAAPEAIQMLQRAAIDDR